MQLLLPCCAGTETFTQICFMQLTKWPYLLIFLLFFIKDGRDTALTGGRGHARHSPEGMLPFDWRACALTHTSTVSQICSITHAPHADALLLPIRVFKITPRSSQQRAERSANAQQTESRELAKHTAKRRQR